MNPASGRQLSGGAPDSGAVCGHWPQTRERGVLLNGAQIWETCVLATRHAVFPASRRKQHPSRVLHPRFSSRRPYQAGRFIGSKQPQPHAGTSAQPGGGMAAVCAAMAW